MEMEFFIAPLNITITSREPGTRSYCLARQAIRALWRMVCVRQERRPFRSSKWEDTNGVGVLITFRTSDNSHLYKNIYLKNNYL